MLCLDIVRREGSGGEVEGQEEEAVLPHDMKWIPRLATAPFAAVPTITPVTILLGASHSQPELK